jgi:hypothetical protein
MDPASGSYQKQRDHCGHLSARSTAIALWDLWIGRGADFPLTLEHIVYPLAGVCELVIGTRTRFRVCASDRRARSDRLEALLLVNVDTQTNIAY